MAQAAKVFVLSFKPGNTSSLSLAKFFCSINRPNVKIELLKYHEYGKDKWEKAGLQYKMENAFVREEQRCETEENFRRFGLNVVRT